MEQSLDSIFWQTYNSIIKKVQVGAWTPLTLLWVR